MPMNTKDPKAIEPKNGHWVEVRLKDILPNASFGGTEGNYTAEGHGSFPSPETKIAFYIVDRDGDEETESFQDRVTHIWIGDETTMYRHENFDGANIHGGNHTTEDWFTFDIGQFRLQDANGLINSGSQRLVDEFSFNTFTVCDPSASPCFTGDVKVLVHQNGITDFIAVRDIDPGAYVAVYDSVEPSIALRGKKHAAFRWKPVKYVGRYSTKIMPRTIPVDIDGEVFSPLHRIMIVLNGETVWTAAKHLVEAGLAKFVGRVGDTMEYFHVLLDSHEALITESLVMAESLRVTTLSMSMFDDKTRKAIQSEINNYKLNLEELSKLKHRDARRKEFKDATVSIKKFDVFAHADVFFGSAN